MKLLFIDFLLMEKLCQRERFLLAEESQIALADIHGINFFFLLFFFTVTQRYAAAHGRTRRELQSDFSTFTG